MTIRHLRIFSAVYRCCNVSRAAEQLHMTQPAVSRTIREMETYYGVVLFDRISHRLQPTDAGRRFYQQALLLVDAFDTLEQTVRAGENSGTLQVGCSMTIGSFLMPRIACRFAQAYPDICLKVTVSNAGALETALLENRLDLALIESHTTAPLLEAEVFSQDRMVLVAAPQDPLLQKKSVSLEDVAQRPLLMREAGSAGRSYLTHVFAAYGLAPEPLWESASTQALMKAAEAGLGVAVLPEKLASQDICRGLAGTCKITGETLCRQYFMVHHREKHLTDAARQLMQICREEGKARQ